MRLPLLLLLLLLVLSPSPQAKAAEPEFPLTEDSKPRADVPKGEMIKDTYTSAGDIFPGTQREYQLYIPHGLDRSKPVAFMVFQDGVIYQAPVVFDNLIARKDIPPLIGVFIKPGVVPAANENALPRFNRSYEYDSIADNYSRFLIEEFLPAIEKKHGIKLSTDPNDAAISGNSSGGIAAFMVAWHHPDRFRRVFTGVGTYVGIHGGDRLPVLVRKLEPKPIRIFLQSGTGDNNLYCGDWWMANQMMERSFSWAGYEVNHAWGEGGHNGKHATQIFPDVLRWLWKDWQTNEEIKANAKGESKWKGYEVLVEGHSWTEVPASGGPFRWEHMVANSKGNVIAWGTSAPEWTFVEFDTKGKSRKLDLPVEAPRAVVWTHDDTMVVLSGNPNKRKLVLFKVGADGKAAKWAEGIGGYPDNMVMTHDGTLYCSDGTWLAGVKPSGEVFDATGIMDVHISSLALSPDQTQLYTISSSVSGAADAWKIQGDGKVSDRQHGFYQLEGGGYASNPCVDQEGRFYTATGEGVEVCDQAGRVNFIIATPEPPGCICFGGKDLSELFIACGDKIYKRPMKVRGVVSGQMPPIKPAAPKL
ncbi:alpha/beta hydrolase-fold protein [Roseimicrobium sp. ORNL1]|uniref:SMP-30/gluconolactonase/LRE family protein n=1 Tax=Roseimicrobium sp. ORNL1 TaxID=2711231 RepID=UPI0013E14782|nr:alpha/beta hydrolase-fold protein [Roseimicrobium sp. ORNL1]QIF05367.1 gluconolactonase [Roseimicrobium sp. ORNL1]